MAAEPKRRKNTENEDRISALPDSLLHQILSNVPTKLAVQTSVLSHRWIDCWKDLSVLDFCDDATVYQNTLDHLDQRMKRFVPFAGVVNNVFAYKKTPTHKMRLWCLHSHYNNKICNFSFDAWVPSVFGSNLQEMDIKLCSILGYTFKVPSTINKCINLVSLSLAGSINIDKNLVKVISLPSLKTLKLQTEHIEFDDMNTFLSRCLSLEVLEIFLHRSNFEYLIKPPKTKILKLYMDPDTSCDFMEIRCFDFDHFNLQQLRKASLNICYWSKDSMDLSLSSLLDALSDLGHLTLSGETTKGLSFGLGRLHDKNFIKLRHLDIVLPYFNMNFLMTLLNTCDLLQTFVIQNEKDQRLAPFQVRKTFYKEPEVPYCLKSKLVYIEINGYQDSADEFSFVEYVLQNGYALETVAILDILVEQKVKVHTLDRLSNIPKVSPICKLTFE